MESSIIHEVSNYAIFSSLLLLSSLRTKYCPHYSSSCVLHFVLRDQVSHRYKTNTNLNFVSNNFTREHNKVIFQDILSWLTCFVLLEEQSCWGVEGCGDKDKQVTLYKQPLLRFNTFARKLLSCHKTIVFIPLPTRHTSTHTELNNNSVTDGPIRSISPGSRNLPTYI